MNRDRYMSAPVDATARSTMALVDALQNMPPELQMGASTALFLLLCEHMRVTPQDAFAQANNLMNHAEGRRPEFAAAKAYMEGEL